MPTTDAIAEFAAQLIATDTLDNVAVRLNVGVIRDAAVSVWLVVRQAGPRGGVARMQLSDLPLCTADPLVRHKTFSYATRWLARQRATAAGYDDALLPDDRGNVCEAAFGNLFMRFEGRWRTPALEQPILPGIVRQLLLEEPTPLGPIRVLPIPLAMIDRCEAAFVTNSVRGIVQVQEIAGRELPTESDVVEAAEAIWHAC